MKQYRLLFYNLFMLCLIPFSVYAQTESTELSAQDVDALRIKVTSDELPYSVRLEVVQSAVFYLMQEERESEAKHLFLSFITTIDSENKAPTDPIPPNVLEITHQIDQGMYVEARASVDSYIQSTPNTHDSLSIIALKADHEPAAFYAIFQDAKDETLSSYTTYSIGIMLVRAQGLQRAAANFRAAMGNLQSPKIERWLKIDAAKFNQITKEFDASHTLLDELIAENPKDAQALFWKARVFHTQEQNDRSRETLAKLIPLLYPDVFLVTEAAALALRLNEIETAASILTNYETKIPPTRDFYELFAIIRNLQNQPDAVLALNQKAKEIPVKPEPVPQQWITTTRLNALLSSLRNERREKIRTVSTTGIPEYPLDQVFLFLLLEDFVEAKRELHTAIKAYPPFAEAQYMLSAILRREGSIKEAFDAVLALHQSSPQYRRYNVLAQLADYAVQLGNQKNAAAFYRQIQKEYPASYQAHAASLFSDSKKSNTENAQKIRLSPLMSKFEKYSSTFVIKELLTHWDTHVTFARVSIQTKTTPRKGLNFIELFNALIKGTQYRLVPFSGTVDALAEFLDQEIPVVYCHGGMFASQNLDQVSILTGYDKTRNIAYQEAIQPSTFHILSETELLEGLCMAVYPIEHSATLSNDLNQAIAVGEEYIALNFASAQIANQKEGETTPQFDSKKFYTRMDTITKESGLGFLPLKLASLRHQIQKNQTSALTYAKQIQASCESSAQYWYDLAGIDFHQKNYSKAISLIEKAVEISPSTIRYQIALARSYEKLNRIEEAIALCESLREQYPNNEILSIHLIAFYKSNNEPAKSEQESNRLKTFLNIDDIKVNTE